MNERIRELMEQASSNACYDEPNQLSLLNQEIEVFAELIVEECIEVCKSRVGNSDYTTGRMHCVSDLKEHFGVES